MNYASKLAIMVLIGIVLSGCAASNQPDINITRNIPVGQTHPDPTSLTLYGEKIPFSYSSKVLTYDVSLKIEDYRARRLLGITQNDKFIFSKDDLPTYTLHFKEPFVVVGIKIYDTMKIQDRTIYPTHIEDFGLFSGIEEVAREKYVINEFQGAKEILFESAPFFKEINIKLKSVSLPKGTRLGEKLTISPHIIHIVGFSKTEIYAMAEKILKERKDVDANEKLLQAIKNNDKTFYAKLMKNKDALVLRKEDSIAKQAVSHESVPPPAVTQSQENPTIESEKPMKEEVQKPATIIIDGKEYAIKEPPAQWQKPEEERTNPKRDEASSAIQKPKEKPAEKKPEQPITKKATFSGIAVEKIQIGEDNTSTTIKKRESGSKKDFIDFSKTDN